MEYGKSKIHTNVEFTFSNNIYIFLPVLSVYFFSFSVIISLHRSISLDNIQKIADAFGIDTYKLFIEDTEEEI